MKFVSSCFVWLILGFTLCTASAAENASVRAAAVTVESFYHEVDGINYYLEKRGTGPYLVMVTSGQGDSGAYRFLADILASHYTVITFDPPGFSRSSPPPSWDNLSSRSLGSELAALLTSLGIEEATFYGSSSGGTTVLSLVADYPHLVKKAILHEPAVVADIPFFKFLFPRVMAFKAYMAGGFAEEERKELYTDGESLMISDTAKYRALGEEHLQRRIKNKQIWYDNYARPDIPCCNREFSAEELGRAPLVFTVGQHTVSFFASGVKKMAERAGAPLIVVPGKHFPYATHPQAVADIVLRQK